MTEHAVINGEYVTFKHVKTRKVVVLEVEVPEELFQDVIAKLGMPIGGESKPVAVCLLEADKTCRIPTKPVREEKSEGQKLVTRAVMLCRDEGFLLFCEKVFFDKLKHLHYHGTEEGCKRVILYLCNILSRSELATNVDAQVKFFELIEKYNQWKLENQYSDNLNKEY